MLLAVAASIRAEGDSLRVASEARFRASHVIVPAALIAAGSLGVENGWLVKEKRILRNDLSDLRGGKRLHVDDELQYVPLALNMVLGLTGVGSRHSLRERVAATATACAATALMVNGVKHTVHEKRPYGNRLNSFPSGHTATAFMGAELLREEYGGGIGVGAYALATSIAFLRLYNDRHWLNDVVAGAGVGILSARIGYWLLPTECRLLGWDKGRGTTAATVVPLYSPACRGVQVAVTVEW